jgi:hypothetical protein
MPQDLHLGRGEPALRFIEMPAVYVFVPDEVDRIPLPLHVELPNWNLQGRETERDGRAMAITSVQNLALKENNRLADAVSINGMDECFVLLALKQRKKTCDRVVLKFSAVIVVHRPVSTFDVLWIDR